MGCHSQMVASAAGVNGIMPLGMNLVQATEGPEIIKYTLNPVSQGGPGTLPAYKAKPISAGHHSVQPNWSQRG